MSSINIELAVETAVGLLQTQEAKMQFKQSQRISLIAEIGDLESSVASLRKSLVEAGDTQHKQHGSNKGKIESFLMTVPHAKTSDIFKATNVAKSSVPYTLKLYPDRFIYNRSNRTWKLNE